MIRSARLMRLLALLMALVMLAGACGGSDDDDEVVETADTGEGLASMMAGDAHRADEIGLGGQRSACKSGQDGDRAADGKGESFHLGFSG